MKLDSLAGNAALKRQLSGQASARGLSHAYLISGPAGAGKKTLARLLAAAMVCTGEGERPCSQCPACRKAAKGIHPDIITLAGEDGKDITVGQARALRSDAYIRPNEGERKVYIIENAQTMNPPAQNSLLKLLEEGPAYAAFLLLADNPGGVLTTIRSRCEGLSLTPVSPQEAEAFLLGRFPDKSPQAVKEAAARCGGVLGVAVKALEGEAGNPVRDAALELLDLLAKGDELALAAFAVTLEKWDRESFARLTQTARSLLREALALPVASAAAPEPVLRASRLPGKALLNCVEVLGKLGRDAEFNVGVGHLAGAMSAGLSQALQSTKPSPAGE